MLDIPAVVPVEAALAAYPRAAVMSPAMLVKTAVEMWLMCVFQVRANNIHGCVILSYDVYFVCQ